MKPFLNVEKDRKKYHKDPHLNTVHRSSLFVPKISSNKTFISFLNHFLLKRNYKDVVLKITGYKQNGDSGDSISYAIDRPIVYTFNLEELGEIYTCYQIEFFSSNNLFVPFPAVMVNHIGEKSINTVHSYNRVLNDSREEDNVNKLHLREASIDFALSKNINTFFVIQTGLMDLENKFLELSLEEKNSGDRKFLKKIPISIKKMNSKKFNMNEIFNKEFHGKDIVPSEYTLRVLQPKQNMFYGRLLVGIEDINSGSFSGNHSYYDNSQFEEYFNSISSYRTFPYFSNAKNRLRIYPIMSKGRGSFTISINFLENGKIESKFLDKFNFENTKTTLSIDVDELIANLNLNLQKINTFTVLYSADDNYKAPTRVNMQLIYGSKLETNLDSSINVSLLNQEIFSHEGKSSYTWIQMVNLENYNSRIGICFSDKEFKQKSENIFNKVDIYFFDSSGCFMSKEIELNFLELFELDSNEINSKDLFIWIVAKSKTPNLQICTFHTNQNSNFSSGEHGF